MSSARSVVFLLAALGLNAAALAQNFAGIGLNEILQAQGNNGTPRAGSYFGPHSGVSDFSNGGPGNDYRGVVFDGGSDAFDWFGYLSVSGSPAQRSIQRRVETISTGGDSAFRWADTITNTSAVAQNFTVVFGGNLGSDAATLITATGTRYRVTTDGGPGDPPVGLVYGNVAAGQSGIVGTLTTPGAVDEVRVTYTLSLNPGDSATLLHLAILGAQSPGGQSYVQTRCGQQSTGAYAENDPLERTGCALTGPVSNWRTIAYNAPIRGDIVQDAALTTFDIAYVGPSDGNANLIGLGAGTDYRGTVLDGGGDAFDFFGFIGVSGSAAQRTISRRVEALFSDCDTAWRWIDTITNTSGAPAVFEVRFGGDLGSDNQTRIVHEGATWLVTTEGSTRPFPDPPVAFVWGSNAFAEEGGLGQADFVDRPYVQYMLTLDPGQSATFVHFAIAIHQYSDIYPQIRAEQLVVRSWEDRLFAGVTPDRIVNWAEKPNPYCPADFNKNGFVQVNDIFLFLTAWFSGCG